MKFKFRYLLILLLIPVMFFLVRYYNNFKIEKNSDEVKKVIDSFEDSTSILKKKYSNDDVVGSISIPGLDINEAILQYTDNDYYLTHNNYGENDKYGSVFLDYRCDSDSKKILIFGHNYYNSNTPFSKLENYYYENFYKQNQYLDIILGSEQRKYQIFSVYIETKDFTYMNLKIDDDRYNQDLIKYKNKSFYETGVDVSLDDEILILQTCSNSPNYKSYKNKFLLIVAKRIK